MKDDFGAELKGWRAQKGLSQASAAAVLGVPVRTLQDWEQGHRKPGALAAEALRSKFNTLDVQKGAAAALVQENQNKSAGLQPAAAAKHRKTYGSQYRNKKR